MEVSRAAQAAIAYIRGLSGMISPLFISKKNETVDLINLAILQLADHYYNARSATVSGNLREYDLGFTSLILQLKASYLLLWRRSSVCPLSKQEI